MFPEPGYMPVLVMCGPRSLPQVESLVFGTDLEDAEVLQRHMMVQMLMERRILEEETDRGSLTNVFSIDGLEDFWMIWCTPILGTLQDKL